MAHSWNLAFTVKREEARHAALMILLFNWR